MLRRLIKAIGLLTLLAALLLAVDYAVVRAKEKHLAATVNELGGQMGSIPAWPLGTEYRVTFKRALADKELERLAVGNKMRGWVGVAFRDCELSATERAKTAAALPNCRLILIQEDEMQKP